MLSCSLLLKLPSDWQLKMHNEITTKLKLCISDMEVARNIATETWRYLSQDDFDKTELSLKLKPYLNDHAHDFTEWVSDFAQKSIEYYLETHSNIECEPSLNGSSLSNSVVDGGSLRGKEPCFNVLLESNSRILKNALKGLATQNSVNSAELQSNNSFDTSSNYSNRSQNNLDSSVDPLDDTLDNLIRKEKIAKLQGQPNANLGFPTKVGKFKHTLEMEHDNPRRFKSKPPFFKNLTLVNIDQNNDSSGNPALSTSLSTSSTGSYSVNSGVTKVPKMCMNFPNCQFGENCRYIHPNKMCKNWPDCFYGDKCAFIHPSK